MVYLSLEHPIPQRLLGLRQVAQKGLDAYFNYLQAILKIIYLDEK